MALGQPAIPVCLGLKGFLGHETFSVESRKVLNKPDPLVTVHGTVVSSSRNLGPLYAVLGKLSATADILSLSLSGFRRNQGRASYIRSLSAVQEGTEGSLISVTL